MTLEHVLVALKGLKARLLDHIKLIYLKLEIAESASDESIRELDAGLPFALDDRLKAMWKTAESVQFEWFIKSDGIRLAAMDTRLAPNGQFSMLTPQESAQEYRFLSDLSMDAGEDMPFVPFARMHPNGELLAVDHSAAGAVVLVVLDLALTVYQLAPDIPSWFQQRMITYFADATIDPEASPNAELTAILKAFNESEVVWPPERRGWS